MAPQLSVNRAAMLAVACCAGFLALTQTGVMHGTALTVFADVAVTVAAAAATGACVLASTWSHGRARQAWVLLAVATGLWLTGEFLWSFYEIILGDEAPFPSPADIAYLAAVPVTMAALLTFPNAPSRVAKRALTLIDGLIVAGALFFISWLLVLGPVYRAGEERGLAAVISLAYPVGDVVIAAVGITVLTRARREGRSALAILCCALIAMAAADSAYAVLTLDGTYFSGHLVDVGWVVSYLGIAVAALAPGDGGTDRAAESESRIGVLLPYLPLTVAAGVLLWHIRHGRPLDEVAILTLGAAAGLAFGRQLLTMLDNVTLTHSLAEREERFRSLVQESTDVVTIIDGDGFVTFQSPAVRRIFGYDAGELVGRQLIELIHPDDRDRVARQFVQAGARPGGNDVIACRLQHADGSWRYIETVVSNQLSTPAVLGLVLNTRDVSERKALEEQLIHQAFHDSLTRLANRALFRERVQHALELRVRMPQPLGVLFIDLDGFKSVNDSLGHSSGDSLLAMTAVRLRESVRPGDTVARLGGDEFAVLLEGVEGPHACRAVAERFLDSLRPPFEVDGRQVFVNASIGVALAGPHETADDLLRNADLAMYRAKALGKGRAELFELGMHAEVLQRLETESDLRRAIAGQELFVYYQPIFNLRTGVAVGVEALLRWRRPDGALVSPDNFIGVAEESGLIVPIGRWVLEQACRQAVKWNEAGRPLRLSVNVSGRQVQTPDLADEVAQILRETGLPPSQLVLEITESMLIDDADRTITKLHGLRDLGLHLAVDDFGTGYSSLSYLRRLPVDILKIDRSFVSGVGQQGELTALTGAIVALGRRLGLEMVAEGIEDHRQLHELRQMDCQFGQGFLFSPALLPADIDVLLEGRQMPQSVPAGVRSLATG
ncbi:MAG: putative bifunctional diguanylate cyclase/phosphodiesterase [Mycobacteriales bacterium]